MSFITDKLAVNKTLISSYFVDVSGNINIDGSIFLRGSVFVGGAGDVTKSYVDTSLFYRLKESSLNMSTFKWVSGRLEPSVSSTGGTGGGNVNWASGSVGSNNQVLTAYGDGSIVAESKLTFDFGKMVLDGSLTIGTATYDSSSRLVVRGPVTIGDNNSIASGLYDLVVNGSYGGIYLNRTNASNEPFLLLSNNNVGSGGQLRGLNSGGLKITNVTSINTIVTFEPSIVTYLVPYKGKQEKRISRTASTVSIAPDVDSYDGYDIYFMTSDLSIQGYTGVPTNKQILQIDLKDNGIARNIVWNSSFGAGGTSLPTATTAGKQISMILMFDVSAGKFKLRSLDVDI